MASSSSLEQALHKTQASINWANILQLATMALTGLSFLCMTLPAIVLTLTYGIQDQGNRLTMNSFLETAGFSAELSLFISQFMGLFSLFVMVVSAISGIVYLVWVYRINKNLEVMGIQGKTYSPVWAILWHFIPLLNLVKPFAVVREAWKASTSNQEKFDSGWQQEKTPVIITAWWVLFLLYSLTNNTIPSRIYSDTLYLYLIVSTASQALGVASSAITALLIRQLARRQEEKITLLISKQP
jgi:hypothetical protein